MEPTTQAVNTGAGVSTGGTQSAQPTPKPEIASAASNAPQSTSGAIETSGQPAQRETGSQTSRPEQRQPVDLTQFEEFRNWQSQRDREQAMRDREAAELRRELQRKAQEAEEAQILRQSLTAAERRAQEAEARIAERELAGLENDPEARAEYYRQQYEKQVKAWQEYQAAIEINKKTIELQNTLKAKAKAMAEAAGISVNDPRLNNVYRKHKQISPDALIDMSQALLTIAAQERASWSQRQREAEQRAAHSAKMQTLRESGTLQTSAGNDGAAVDEAKQKEIAVKKAHNKAIASGKTEDWHAYNRLKSTM